MSERARKLIRELETYFDGDLSTLSKYCPNCNKESVFIYTTYCGDCGTRLEDSMSEEEFYAEIEKIIRKHE